MNLRYKITALLLLLSLTAMMFFPTSNNIALGTEIDQVNPSSTTEPLEGITPAGVDDIHNATIPVLEEETVYDAAPDTNLNGSENSGGIFVGRHLSGAYGRGWFKFDLPDASSTYEVTRARMFIYLENEYVDLVDAPIGAYYSSDDSWGETTITWNNQPSFDAMHLDLINSPASPNMFVELNYYSWDVTNAVSTSLLDDGILSVVLKQENESIDYSTFKYFVEREYSSAHAAYLELEWHSVPAGSTTFNGTIPILEEEAAYEASPDTPLHGDASSGGIFVGRHLSGAYGRGWFKYNLSDVPNDFQITSARMFVYLENEYSDLVDAPIGAYYSGNNSWSETTITWNNQPSFDAVPLDLIDSPASPNMFAELNYYSWDVTRAVSSSLLADDILSVVLRQENESIDYKTFKYFVEREYSSEHASYLELEWKIGRLNNATLPVLEEETVFDATPDTNLNGSETSGGIFVGRHLSGAYGRGWFKFDFSRIPSGFRISSVRMFAYLENEYADDVDAPIGAYYSNDDSWDETTITWNNQPSSDSMPLDLIDSPASPDMFIDFNYYSWDVTNAAVSSMMGDGYLSVVLRQANESIDYSTFKYFVEREYNINHSAYLEVEWYTPATTALTVDGQSETPYLDYISNPNPELGWSFFDQDIDDSQSDYEVEIYSEGANQIWNKNQSTYESVFNQGTDQNARPFYSTSQMKFQFKYPSSLIPQSGVLDKLYFDINLDAADLTYSNFSVFMLNMNNATALSSDFMKNYDGGDPTSVFFSNEFRPEIRNGQLVIDVWNNFFCNGDLDLLIELKYTSMTGPAISSNYSLTSTGSVAYVFGPYAHDNWTADYTYGRTHNMHLEYASDIVSEGGPGNNLFPFNATSPMTLQLKYNKSLIEHSGFINRLYFKVRNMSGTVTLENFKLYLAETPREGSLGFNFTLNYQGETPVMVLDEASYEMSFENYWLVIDIPDIFYYSGMNDLLIEFRFTEVTGAATMVKTFTSSSMDDGGTRAWSFSHDAIWANDVDNYTYTLAIQMIYPESSVTYEGPSLVNGTSYTLSVRTSDFLGVWSQWSELNFTYNTFGFSPAWNNLLESGDPIGLGTAVTVSIYVHHAEGINTVLLSDSSTNYTMTNVSNTYSWTWTPPSLGINTYSIYMSSTLGYWNTTAGTITTIDTTNPHMNSVGRNPLSPTDVDVVTISANVSDEVEVDTVLLEYSDGNQAVNVTMNLSGSLYEADIPAFPRGTDVVYEVHANDSSGNWITSSQLGYSVSQSTPLWSDLIESSGSIELGASVTVSIDVSHSIGVSLVLLAYSGTNFTMQNTGGTYNWTFTPDVIGSANYAVYMLSSNGYWNTTSGAIDVIDTTNPIVVSVGINPLSPTDAASVIVTANLSDLGGFQEAILQYDTGSGWTNISMTASGTVFTGEIQALPEGTIVTYRIYAIDPSGNWVLSAEDSYTVSDSSTTTTTTPTIPTTTTNTTTPDDFTDLMPIIVIASIALVAVIAVIGLRSTRKKS